MNAIVGRIIKDWRQFMGIKEDINELADRLRRERDQLSVKIHLANMEVRDEWQDLEEKWEEFSSSSRRFYKEVEPAMSDIHAALSLLGDELKAGYKKIRDAL
jgi:SMC interacting uncharacterized protein involved in chromosome segregation